jgi:predicted ester cyclase
MAAFPDLLITVDHVCWLPNGPDGYRVATRWTLQGTHRGPSAYGEPTGKRVRLIGITHHEIQDKQIVKEWLVFDEFMLLKQLCA